MNATPIEAGADRLDPVEHGWRHLSDEEIMESIRYYADRNTREEALSRGISACPASRDVTRRGRDTVLFLGQFVRRDDAIAAAMLLGSAALLESAIKDGRAWLTDPLDLDPALRRIRHLFRYSSSIQLPWEDNEDPDGEAEAP